jgi:hypothetical protein
VLEKDVDDLSLLRKDVAQLQRDLARLKEEVVAIELMKRNAQLSDVATKADLKEFASNLKGWMLGTALTVMTLNFGMNVLFYDALKTAAGIKPTQAQQTIPLAKPAPLSLEWVMSPLDVEEYAWPLRTQKNGVPACARTTAFGMLALKPSFLPLAVTSPRASEIAPFC